jgi:uncharacterized protein (TIGR03435 family)
MIPRPGGRVEVAGMPLKLIIQQAWNLPNDRIVDAPKWMDTNRYDITAKTADDGPGSPAMNIDVMWGLLRGLLEDRFALKTHMEERPLTAYNLVAVKPKLKKADPSSRTKWTTDRSPNGAGLTKVTVQNMTMAQFASKLPYIAPNYARTAVLDATGLEGGYDFTFTFNMFDLALIAGGGRGGTPGQDASAPGAPGLPQASDPSGSVTLFEAVEKQLGLKLETTKRPVPVLVIDHVNQTPTEN